MEAVFLMASCLLLPFKYLGELDVFLSKSCRLAGFTYAYPMAYVVEGGTSCKRVYQLPASRLGGVVGTLP